MISEIFQVFDVDILPRINSRDSIEPLLFAEGKSITLGRRESGQTFSVPTDIALTVSGLSFRKDLIRRRGFLLATGRSMSGTGRVRLVTFILKPEYGFIRNLITNHIKD